MGIVSTAIAGHWGDDSAATIGALAIGVSIFNFIYWNCSFVRMGTSGLTAQAFGAGRFGECANMLARALAAAGAMGLLMVALQYPLGELALWAMHGGEMTRDYFYARIWAVPAGILLFGFNGWYTGMNAVFPMCTAITVNVVHTLCSLWFAFGMDLGIVGIAYASVVAQWTGVALSLRYCSWRATAPFSGHRLVGARHETAQNLLHRQPRHHAAYALHRGGLPLHGGVGTAGNPVLLAVNTLLLELRLLVHERRLRICHEALTGRFIGARDGGRCATA